MSKVICEREDLVAVADAIRNKLALTHKMTLGQIVDSIKAICNDEGAEIAMNTTTNKVYSNVQKALNTALDNQTIILLDDVEEANIFVPKNVTLDLNGCTLNVSSMSSLGNVIDSSEDNTGLLIPSKGVLLQKNNSQLSVKNEYGYKFFEILKFNEAISNGKFVYQPFIEPLAHELIKNGSELSGVSIGAYMTYNTSAGIATETYTINPLEDIISFLDSYNSSTGKYGKMLAFNQSNSTSFTNLKYYVKIKSDTGVEIISIGVAAA